MPRSVRRRLAILVLLLGSALLLNPSPAAADESDGGRFCVEFCEWFVCAYCCTSWTTGEQTCGVRIA